MAGVLIGGLLKMKNENIINYFFRHLYRVSVLSPMITPLLLVINISMSIYGFIQEEISIYIALPVIFITITIFILWLAYFLVHIKQIQRNQKKAQFMYDPSQNRHFAPFQQIWINGLDVEIMHYLVFGDKNRLKKALDKAKRWGKTGYFANDDVPADLKMYFKGWEKKI